MHAQITRVTHTAHELSVNILYPATLDGHYMLWLTSLTKASEFHLYSYIWLSEIGEQCYLRANKAASLERPQTSDNPPEGSAQDHDNWQESERALS
jgi:hypothetical protein